MSIENRHNPDLRADVEELRLTRSQSESTSDTKWNFYDLHLSSFAREFMPVTPGGEDPEYDYKKAEQLFMDYLGKILKPESNHHLAAIELGGPGVNLFDDFPEHFFEKTLGVCLPDTKNPIQKPRPSHEIVRGDLLRNDTYTKIETVLNGDKVDLIISRMRGGIDEATNNPVIWAKLAKKWYKFLREGGLMFVQFKYQSKEKIIPKDGIQIDLRDKLMKEWVAFIQNNYGDTLEIQLGDKSFRLLKKEGAPEDLPVLQFFDRTPIVEKF